MFEGISKRIMADYKVPEQVQFDISNSPIFNPHLLERQLLEVESLTDNELHQLLSTAYHTILDKTFVNNNKALVANLFLNERFVFIFSQVLMSVIPAQFSEEEITMCNSLIYDYNTHKGSINNNIRGLLSNLSFSINSKKISDLLSIGLSQDIATQLVVARYSTTNEHLSVIRVNIVIINSPMSVMTEQMIVFIYEKLYDNLTTLFDGIMFDVWDDKEFDEDDDREEIYGTISLALLDILNDTTMTNIVAVLVNFAQLRTLKYIEKPIRFNIKAIAVSDYSRIIEAIDYTESVREIQIPSR